MVEVGYYDTCSIFDYRRYNSSMEQTLDSSEFVQGLMYYRG
jgi:hypothetical protein